MRLRSKCCADAEASGEGCSGDDSGRRGSWQQTWFNTPSHTEAHVRTRARTAESMSEKMTAGRDISRHSCDCPERPHTRTASAAHTLGRAAATAQADLEIFKLLRVVSAAFRKPVRACFSYVNENLKPLIFFFLSLFWSSIPFSIYYYISPSKLQNKLQNVGVI